MQSNSKIVNYFRHLASSSLLINYEWCYVSITFWEEGVEELWKEEPPIDDKTNCEIAGAAHEGRFIPADESVGESSRQGHANGSIHHVANTQHVVALKISDTASCTIVPVVQLPTLLPPPVYPLALTIPTHTPCARKLEIIYPND